MTAQASKSMTQSTTTPSGEGLKLLRPTANLRHGPAGPIIFTPIDVVKLVKVTGRDGCLYGVEHEDGRTGMWAASCFRPIEADQRRPMEDLGDGHWVDVEPQPPVADSGGEGRDLSGETVLGMRVAGYRWERDVLDTKAWAYASHWSTPGENQQVERLFTEADVRAALSAQPAAHGGAIKAEVLALVKAIRRCIRGENINRRPENDRTEADYAYADLVRLFSAKRVDAILAALTAPSSERAETCKMCGGRGEIGGHRGQTAESFEWVTEPCPDCAHPPQQRPDERLAVATGAEAVIRDGQIVISVDVDALPIVLSGSIALNAVSGTYKVTDAVTFAKEVCMALNAEKEDGTTRVHMMFDGAFNHAIDQGAEGVEEIGEDEFKMEAARLQSAAAEALRLTTGAGK